MRSSIILQEVLSNNHVKLHTSHINFLNVSLESIYSGAKLTCTSIGRNIQSNTTPKHNIKRVNYMLSSLSLQHSRIEVYRAIAKSFLSSRCNPRLSIDWSSSNPTRNFQILRATLTVRNNGGRGITIYEETHPYSKLNNHMVHKKFLDNLADIIPVSCKPIILTDAGFKNNWFRNIENRGWYYIGRVRGSTYYKTADNSSWEHCRDLHITATTKPQYIGNIILAKRNNLKCHAFLVKQASKNRKKITVMGKISKASSSTQIATREREPWLLVTNLPGGADIKYDIINHYKTRMQIEETFRDTKGNTLGMGLKEHRSRSQGRINILLLIGTIAHIIKYIIGLCITREQKQFGLQANTVRNRKVLSYVYIGKEYLRRKFCDITPHVYLDIIKEITHEFV